MNLATMLMQQADHRPGACALQDLRGGKMRSWTFNELEREVAMAAGWLRAQGLKPGIRALVLVPVSAELYILLLALWRLGAAAVIVDPGAGRKHVARCCRRVRPQWLLGTPAALALGWVLPGLREIPRRVAVSRWPWAFGARWWHQTVTSVAAGESDDGGAPALLTFTSGSTGEPKVAVRTHDFLLAQDRALRPALALEPDEVDLVTLPVFVFANLAAGATSFLPALDLGHPGAIDGTAAATQIETHHVTRCTASPAFFARLVAECRRAGRTLPGLRKLFTGGAPVFPDLLDGLLEIAPNARIEVVYGSTEAEPITHLDAAAIGVVDRAAIRRGAGLPAGRPVPEVRVVVLADQWGTVRPVYREDEFLGLRLKAGEVGEIIVSGPHVLRGYLDGAGDEETKFRVGDTVWHRTGDAGRFDDTGRLWLLGRCAAKIEDARGRLYPFTVEAAVAGPEVARAALLALAGRRVLAVEPNAGAVIDPAVLRSGLAWAGIDEVRLLPRIPVDRRHNAKIDYPALRRLLHE